MEKALKISKNNKYFWFYPKNRSEIKLVLNNNSKAESKDILKKKFIKKNKTIDLVLVTIKNELTITKLFPENIYTLINFYKIENNRFYSNKNKLPGKVFFKKVFLDKNSFKTEYLKKIVRKFYFDGVVTKLLNFKYYSNL
ncbi:hypothetical protein crov213 [Cafeteria roenbergensis virus]|uniref:Uncharacterized protein n=1 Tax=Cafeteria roenbergensis virus (strain BV-PW1) TaxID=693272 RepID=E3T4Y3_CROVB|nr:hypothetical protein crov213 [Cafeteria roenbergensis virus BV-PW1]ADO67246.1 hypothetical protein crov213 [Cafeteria roenbergensis virus BV-PW1]